MTTPYIEAKKAEFEKLLDKAALRGGYDPEDMEFLDTLLDEIESRVIPTGTWEEAGAGHWTGCCGEEEVGWDECREKTKANFQHLRTGVETEV